MTGIHFAHPSNRFWPAMHLAGLIDWTPNLSPVAPAVPLRQQPGGETPGISHRYPIAVTSGLPGPSAADTGLTPEQRTRLTRAGLGITNLVSRATARADQLGVDELRAGAERLQGLIEQLSPRVVAVAGITAYRSAFSRKDAVLGRQAEGIAGSELWVIPNPSGLNAHVQTADMASWLRLVADEAEIGSITQRDR
jgi:double-stranded uracil-DNA glycosylase